MGVGGGWAQFLSNSLHDNYLLWICVRTKIVVYSDIHDLVDVINNNAKFQLKSENNIEIFK